MQEMQWMMTRGLLDVFMEYQMSSNVFCGGHFFGPGPGSGAALLLLLL